MKRALPLAALALLAGCAGPGTVIGRDRCKTSTCITVRQDDGHTGSSGPLNLGSYPRCVVGARWPECQGGQR